MELCLFSVGIGVVITAFVFTMIWVSIWYGKHLGRSEKKPPTRPHNP